MAYAKGLISERAESGDANVRDCIAAGASILTAIDVTAGATAMAWSQADENGVTEGISPLARDSCAT